MVGDSPRLRLTILGVVGLSLFAALFARLWYLQVIGTEEFQLAAAVQNTRTQPIEAPRGRIFDAQGRVVVDNRVALIVTLDPEKLALADDPDDVLERLATALTRFHERTKAADLRDRLADPRYNEVETRPVALDVSDELEVYLVERTEQFPGVEVRRETVRFYPYGSVASHLTGYVGRISAEEFEERSADEDAAKPYAADHSIGKTGIERVYEEELRGTPGVRVVEVDARGQTIRTLDYQPPVPGNDLQLTVDIDVQAATEAALARGLEDSRARPPQGRNPTHTAPAGSIVVVDPSDGSLVAMASYPTYDNSDFVGGISSARYAELLGDESTDDPFTNRALSGQYAPGSTFKLITAYAAMRDGLIDEHTSRSETLVYQAMGCAGGEQCYFGSPGATGVSNVNVQSALRVSSNTFFYWLGDRYWVEEGLNRTGIQEAAEDLGLGAPTGIPLPFEQGGWVPTPERKAQRHEQNPEAFPYGEWYSGDNIITSIGQGDVLVTPLQLANAYATFANRGVRHEPRVVARVLRPGADPANPGDVLREFEPVVAVDLAIPDHIWQPMHRGLAGVTSEQGGTARSAFEGFDHAGWPVGGKTGTASVQGRADTALFVGYGPAPAPRYAVAVVLEEAGFAGSNAGPVARWLFDLFSGQVPVPPAARVDVPMPPPECPPPPDDEADAAPTTTSTTPPGNNPLAPPPCEAPDEVDPDRLGDPDGPVDADPTGGDAAVGEVP
jgi:penicillin-binding protein 2